MSEEYKLSNQQEYYIYYDDKNGDSHFQHVNMPDNDKQIVIHNNTINDNNLNDTGFMFMSFFFHLLAILFFYELGKTFYRRFNRNNNERLVITPNSNYYHNKVVVIEEISEETCSICLDKLYDKDDLENNKSVISLKCNHMFHKECIDPWVMNNKCCPLCKRNT